MNYKQCHLEKKTTTGVMHQTSYLPEHYARVGKVLKLRDDRGIWEDGWKVTAAHFNSVPESALPDWHKTIRGHRTATGDSLPK